MPGTGSQPLVGQSTGPAIDRTGAPVVDPTPNVLDLVAAAVRRIDDLMEINDKHSKEQEGMRRYFEGLLREAEKGRRDAEKDRLDAIRIIDVTAVAASASEANERANTLAVSQANQAEALRVQVANTATAFEAKLTNVIEPIQKDLAELRRSMYEGIGQKTQITESRDNASDMAPILEAIHALQLASSERSGGSAQHLAARDTSRFGLQLMGAVIGFVLFVVTILEVVSIVKKP